MIKLIEKDNEDKVAFPIQYHLPDDSGDLYVGLGLTKREWFVGMAVQGLCAAESVFLEHIPKKAIEIADKVIQLLGEG